MRDKSWKADPRSEEVAALPTKRQLIRLSNEWLAIIPSEMNDEPALKLLSMSRRLFVHSWYDYEFLAVAMTICFQALEAAFRRLYLDASDRVPFKALVNRLEDEVGMPSEIVAAGYSAVEIRNLLSHPLGIARTSFADAAVTLEGTHRYVAYLITMAYARESA